MLKYSPLLFLYLFLTAYPFSLAVAQTWEPVGGGVSGGDTLYPPVSALCVYHNKLYAAGNFIIAGSRHTNSIACWNGKKWDTVGVGIKGTVYALTVFNDKLIAGGTFRMSFGNRFSKNIAQWNDTTWSGLGIGVDKGVCSGMDLNEDGIVNDLCVYKNKLYAAGCFHRAGGMEVFDIARWDGYNWSQVISIRQKSDNEYWFKGVRGVFEWPMIVYKDELCIGGVDMAENIPIRGIARWNGERWDSLAVNFLKEKYSIYYVPPISSFAEYNGELYVGGGFDSAREGHNRIVGWDGKKWFDLSRGTNMKVDALFVFQGILYAGGVFTEAGGKPAKHIASWDGKDWGSVGLGFDGKPNSYHMNEGRVTCFTEYNGELYAGGYFTSSDGVTLNHIAKLNLKGTKPTSAKSKK